MPGPLRRPSLDVSSWQRGSWSPLEQLRQHKDYAGARGTAHAGGEGDLRGEEPMT